MVLPRGHHRLASLRFTLVCVRVSCLGHRLPDPYISPPKRECSSSFVRVVENTLMPVLLCYMSDNGSMWSLPYFHFRASA
jgi:hypothetical protein